MLPGDIGIGDLGADNMERIVKRLHKALVKYYTEHLGHTLPETPPSLTAIAKDQNVEETVNLLKIVIAAAVQSEDKQRYIQGIQTMREEAQEVIMNVIREVSLGKWEGKGEGKRRLC